MCVCYSSRRRREWETGRYVLHIAHAARDGAGDAGAARPRACVCFMPHADDEETETCAIAPCAETLTPRADTGTRAARAAGSRDSTGVQGYTEACTQYGVQYT